MILSDIVLECAQLTDFYSDGDTAATIDTSHPFIVKLINQTISEICDYHTWKFLNLGEEALPTVSGQDYIDLSDLTYGVDKIKRVLYYEDSETKFRLLYKPSIEIDLVEEIETGIPSFYDDNYEYNKLRLYPVPDAVYTLYIQYAKKYTFTDDTSISANALILPDDFRSLLVQGTIAKIFGFDDEVSKSRTAYSNYQSFLEKKKTKEQNNLDYSPSRIRPVRESYSQNYINNY